MSKVEIQAQRNPGCLIQLLWFALVGWWAGQIWVAIAWALMLTVIGIPLASRRQPSTTLLPDGTHARTSWWWGFDDDDMDAIVVELNGTPSGRVMSSRSGEWGTGRKPIACLACGTDERPHFARGMCRRCYSSALAHGEHDQHPVVRKRSQE